MTLWQYCLDDDCDWTARWEGGTAGDDPGLDHLKEHPGHIVRSGADEKHRENYQAQQDGESVTDAEVAG